MGKGGGYERNRDIDADASLPGRTIGSQSRAEPRANIVFTRTHGFAVQIIWYYCTYSTYARAKLFANYHPPAASASLSQRSSRRISISVRANVNAAYCAVVPLKSHDARDAVMIIIRCLASYIAVHVSVLPIYTCTLAHHFQLFVIQNVIWNCTSTKSLKKLLF